MFKSLPLTLVLVLSNLAVSHSITYLFRDEDTPTTTICPLIMSAQAAPSFLMQPSSTRLGFLTGNYSYYGDRVSDFKFVIDRVPCSSSAISQAMCSELSVIYEGRGPIGRGNMVITYTPNEGAVHTILVDYSSEGLSLQDPDRVLKRRPNQMATLDGVLLGYGEVFPPFALCDNATEKRLIGASVSTGGDMVGQCSTNVAGMGEIFDDPIQFDIRVDESVSGRFTVYAAANSNCSSNLRTDPFEILLDPVTEPEVTTVTTEGFESTTPATTPVGGGLSSGAIAGIVVGGAVMAAIVFVAVIVLVLCVTTRNRRQKPGDSGRSRTHSASSGEIDGHHQSFLTNSLLPQNSNLTSHQPRQKKIFIVGENDSAPIQRIAENLKELNGDFLSTSVPKKNGNLSQFVATVVKNKDRVIILGGSGELKEQNTSQIEQQSSRRWIHELEGTSSYTSEELRNVFLVLFGNSESLDNLQVSSLQRVPVPQRLNSENLDFVAIAKNIQKHIEKLLSGCTQLTESGEVSTPNLSTGFENSSTESKRKLIGATPPTHQRVGQLKDEPGTSSASDLHAGSFSQIVTGMIKEGFDKIANKQDETKEAIKTLGEQTRQEGQATRNVFKEGFGELQEGQQIMHSGIEQIRDDLENKELEVATPHQHPTTLETTNSVDNPSPMNNYGHAMQVPHDER